MLEIFIVSSCFVAKYDNYVRSSTFFIKYVEGYLLLISELLCSHNNQRNDTRRFRTSNVSVGFVTFVLSLLSSIL